jgi:SAM-dependent methyltransferase
MSDAPTGDEIRSAWDANAAYWDEHMEAGRTWQRTLIQPTVERLLMLRPGERVLEIACGNGEFSRRMAELGARVLATDFSERMLERARARRGDVEYRLVDATDESSLAALESDGPFDAVVCNMALMDISDLEPLAQTLPFLLAEDGRFVFSIRHPSFNAGDIVRTLETTDVEHEVIRMHSVRVSTYRSLTRGRGIALEGQPEAQWYFDRPLAEVLRPFLEAGLVLDGLEEPTFDPADADPTEPEYVYTELPAVLVARLRPSARP